MSKSVIRSFAAFVGVLLCALSASAQEGGTYSGYSPYSVYGVGPLHQAGTVYNQSMGGVGIASRNNRYLNIMNPAAVTARDSLAFMADFGLTGRASIFNDGTFRSGNNLFNISNIALSFPIYGKSAFMIGITPYSDVGYKFSVQDSDPANIAESGIKTSVANGEGSMFQFFTAAGITFWNRLSIGAQYNYVFGNIVRNTQETYSSSSMLGHHQSYDFQLQGHSAKFGLQYEQPIGNNVLGIGATYLLGSPLNGYRKDSFSRIINSGEETPTESENRITGMNMGSEIGAGVSFRMSDKYRFEVDYTYSDWSNSGFDAVEGLLNENFSSTAGFSVKAGMEYTPNRNDIRYYMRRVSYRAGAYFEQSPFVANGKAINDIGVTFGATFPVFRWYNGITFSVQAGQRGVAGGGMVRERYFGFGVSANIFDIWFQKPHYE